MCSLEVAKCLAEYKPFVCVLKTNQKILRCDFCFKSLRERVECNDCHKSWYCNEFCRKSDLMTHHFECDPNFDLIDLISKECSDPKVTEESDWSKFKDSDEFVTHTLLLLRILFKLKSDPNLATIEYPLGNGLSVSYDDIVVPNSKRMHMVWDDSTEEDNSNEPDLVDDFSYNFGAWLLAVNNILNSDFIKYRLGSIPDHILMKAFRIVIRYTLYVCDMSFLNEIGKAIYVEMCFISHSCVPNCGPLFQESNALTLRVLSEGVTDFSHLKYDFQIEMTAYSTPELSESLLIRSIECECKLCSSGDQFPLNYHKNVTTANLKYGNWPLLDYCTAMSTPIEEALDYMNKIHGNHPFTTGLLLWKLRNEWNLFNSELFKDDIYSQLYQTFKQLKDRLWITHGSQHIWFIQLVSIEKQLESIKTMNDSFDLEIIEKTIDQIIPKSVIDQKLT